MITIAIPFYNAEKFLLRAIKSVFVQTFTEWELLLIDDGSTDNSLAIARSISDPRVRVISDGQNKKLATRLNEVTDLAKYNYIARMDADDMMDPHRLAIQYSILCKDPDLDLVSCGMFSCTDDDQLVGYRGQNYLHPTFDDILYKRVGILHASVLARKSWYIRNKYNQVLLLGQDTDMWLRAAKKDDLRIKIIEDPLYIYREEGNVTPYKLLRAYKNEREYLAYYITSPQTRAIYILKSHMKSILVNLMGAPRFLLQRRNALVPKPYEHRFFTTLKTINDCVFL